MSFVALQDSLRKELRKRIEAGELTGMDLARRTGFTQAHISNFLNRKRGLKLTALDRMLKAIGLTIYDLLNPHDLVRFAAVPSGTDEEYAEVPVVDANVAASSQVIVHEEVKQKLKFRRAFLSRIRLDLATPARKSWTRFVLIQVDPRDAQSMWPRIAPGATLLIDRHYTSLHPYRKTERNVYAVRKSGGLTVKYVELCGNLLVLRPENPEVPVEVLTLDPGQNYGDLLVGRVAQMSAEI